MKTASDFTSPPSDYSLIVPNGWFQIGLDPEDRDRGIIALADRQFRGVDNAPHLKKEFMRDLQKRARNAYKAGGTELYISTLTVGPLPLASSLLISVPPPDEWPSVSEAEEFAEFLADRYSVRGRADDKPNVVRLTAAGEAVRHRRRETADPTGQLGNTLPTTTLTYYVRIPATSRWLIMTFSTPMDPLADRMVELFDTVADTLHWT